MSTAIIKNIAVFCGSSAGSDQVIINDCIRLAQVFCERNIKLIYGGGNVGLMGLLADEMLTRGGEVIGVIPEKLVGIEVAHHGVTKLHIVEGMHERKALMASLADAFIILPGGIGTMEEFFEIYTWKQLNYHNKPIAISNINGFYDIVIEFLNSLVKKGFVRQSVIDQLIIEPNSQQIVERLLDAKTQFP